MNTPIKLHKARVFSPFAEDEKGNRYYLPTFWGNQFEPRVGYLLTGESNLSACERFEKRRSYLLTVSSILICLSVMLDSDWWMLIFLVACMGELLISSSMNKMTRHLPPQVVVITNPPFQISAVGSGPWALYGLVLLILALFVGIGSVELSSPLGMFSATVLGGGALVCFLKMIHRNRS